MPVLNTTGQLCLQAGRYGQYFDLDGAYAGPHHDCVLAQGAPFPRPLPAHHFRLLGPTHELYPATTVAQPRALHASAWDPNDPIGVG